MKTFFFFFDIHICIIVCLPGLSDQKGCFSVNLLLQWIQNKIIFNTSCDIVCKRTIYGTILFPKRAVYQYSFSIVDLPVNAEPLLKAGTF